MAWLVCVVVVGLWAARQVKYVSEVFCGAYGGAPAVVVATRYHMHHVHGLSHVSEAHGRA